MIQPPGAAAGRARRCTTTTGWPGSSGPRYGLQCSDMTSLIGNNVAGMVFDAAKALDRVTITVYQSAAGNGILSWLSGAVDRLITALGNAIYFPYLAPVVILGAIWLAWQGLIRKRATRTIEGTLWMVVACVAAIALIGRPADVHRGRDHGLQRRHPGAQHRVLQAARPGQQQLPAGAEGRPAERGRPTSPSPRATPWSTRTPTSCGRSWSASRGWTASSAPPPTRPAAGGQQTVVNKYGRQLLWAQAIAANETPSTALVQAKQSTYSGIASSMQQQDPAVYPLFQGNQWTTRLEIAFAAMFAALVAGLLILLIAMTLIILKLGFLLLLVAGPFFLIVGTHPGFGRVIAHPLVRDARRRADEDGGGRARAVSVLLYCYSLIMGTS